MGDSRSVSVLYGIVACVFIGGVCRTSAAFAAAAADPAPQGLEEITVTARMKAESLISVPVAVSAVSAEQLNLHAATDLSSIAELAPQVIVTQTQNGGGGAFNIRGIGSSPSDPGIEQSVSINLDGVQLSRGRLVTMAMFDLAQVEVLKGPQALFFGKNSDAGVISLTSAGTTNTFQSTVKAGYEFTTDRRTIEGSISGPFTEQLRFRLAARASEDSGYLYNMAVAQPSPFHGPDLPQPGAADVRQPANREGNVRLTLDYQPTSNLDATIKLLGGKDRGNSNTGATTPICPKGEVPFTLGVPDPTGYCSQPGDIRLVRSVGALNPTIARTFIGAGDGRPYSKTDLFIGSAKVDYRMDHLTLTSVTGFAWLNYKGFDNTSWVTYCEVCSYEFERDASWSEELRLSSDFDFPVNFTVGAYYQNTKTNIFADYNLGNGPDPRTGSYAAVFNPTTNFARTLSPFGQVRWNITHDLELAAGARWTQETKTTLFGNTFVNQAFTFFRAENDFLGAGQKFNNWSPEATVSWHPTERSTLYAAYKTGYKSGGFSSPGVLTTAYTAQNVVFDPEKARGFEIGYKAELLNRTLRLEADAYRYTYSNLQLSSFDVNTFSYVVRNAGSARTQGVEGSVEWQAAPNLNFNSTIAYNRARYIGFDTAQCYQTQPVTTVPGVSGACFNGVQDLSGRPLVRAPDIVGNVGVSYDTALFGLLRIGLNADARYSSGFYPEETDSPDAHEKAFWLVNAGVRLHPEDDKWELALLGTNLTKHLYFYAGAPFEFGPGNAWAYAVNVEPPREVLLQATVHF